MGRVNELCTFRLINGEGELNVKGMETFVKNVKLSNFETSTIVSIMGPQSSGKSTLLNHLFHTDFKEMNAADGRWHQTTEGIWLAKCPDIKPCTIIMDLEGSDGGERGEDDTAFEKMAALFAFVVSDIVIINMWCKDLGLNNGSNKPLLRTVFEAMGKLFKYSKKTTLLFVLRDTTTPEEKSDLKGKIEKIWNSVTKLDGNDSASLMKFFNVKVKTLSSYEHQAEKFKDEVSRMRKGFDKFIRPRGSGKIPASKFCLSIRENWETIKKSKGLNLPSKKVLDANVHYGEIVDEKLKSFKEKKIWNQKDVETCLEEYDNEAEDYDKGVRTEKRRELKTRLLQMVAEQYPHWKMLVIEAVNAAVGAIVTSMIFGPVMENHRSGNIQVLAVAGLAIAAMFCGVGALVSVLTAMVFCGPVAIVGIVPAVIIVTGMGMLAKRLHTQRH